MYGKETSHQDVGTSSKDGTLKRESRAAAPWSKDDIGLLVLLPLLFQEVARPRYRLPISFALFRVSPELGRSIVQSFRSINTGRLLGLVAGTTLSGWNLSSSMFVNKRGQAEI